MLQKTIKNKLPKFLYHLVPRIFFNNYIDVSGAYDCRLKQEWGKNSSFIHTSPSKQILKRMVADPNWSALPATGKFYLLKIVSKKVHAKIIIKKLKGNVYYHIYSKLPRYSFKVIKIQRRGNGKFIL